MEPAPYRRSRQNPKHERSLAFFCHAALLSLAEECESRHCESRLVGAKFTRLRRASLAPGLRSPPRLVGVAMTTERGTQLCDPDGVARPRELHKRDRKQVGRRRVTNEGLSRAMAEGNQS